MGLNCHFLRCQFGEYIFPQRYVMCIMTLLGVTVSFNLRSNLNIALPKIIIQKEISDDMVGHQCPAPEKNEIKEQLLDKFPWTDEQQALILAAFFPGYVLTQILGGILADTYGAKHVFSLSILISGIISIFTPLGIKLGGWRMFVISRAVLGLFLGVQFPSTLTLLAKWAPIRERSVMGGIIASGAHLGRITATLGTGALISKSSTWQMPFYVWGVATVGWYKAYYVLCFSVPSENPYISEKEAEMLERELGGRKNNENFKIPWVKIFTSKTVWAMIVCMVGHTILLFFVSELIPKYNTDVLKSDVTKDGATAAVPYMALFISVIVSGFLSDLIVQRDILSVIMCRKVFCALGGMLPPLFIILMSYMNCDGEKVFIMFTLCLFSMGPMFSSVLINPTDLSNNFAGIIMSIANCLAALLYCPWPNITTAITVNHTIEQWRIVFLMIALLGAISTVFFLAWGSSDKQDFDTLELPPSGGQ